MSCGEPILGSHVDDIFGGFPFCDSYERACHFRDYLCRIGELLTIKFNRKPTKNAPSFKETGHPRVFVGFS